MVDIFEQKMCNYCKNTNCNKRIIVEGNKYMTVYRCEEYQKDSNKIIPYEKPLVVTAKRDYVTTIEV